MMSDAGSEHLSIVSCVWTRCKKRAVAFIPHLASRIMHLESRILHLLTSEVTCKVDPPAVWIIDNIHWDRANLRALLIERGYTVEGFTSIFHAISSLHLGESEKPAVIVLETKNLPFQQSEFDELARTGAAIIILTGVFDQNLDLTKYKRTKSLRRPFTLGQVADAVGKWAN